MHVNMVDVSIAINTGLSLALAYSGFCRLVHTTDKTKISIRVAIIALTLAAILNLIAPGVWKTTPSVSELALLAAITYLQMSTRGVWRYGVHPAFLKAEYTTPVVQLKQVK